MARDRERLEIEILSFKGHIVGQSLWEVYALFPIHNSTWIFHRNDADNWPSTPHGHNRDMPQKIDVYTGEIYDSKTRQSVGRMKSKYLRRLQERLNQKGFFNSDQLSRTLLV